MSAPVENAVKVDWIELPASRNGGNILVQTSDEGDMAWTRFGRYARV